MHQLIIKYLENTITSEEKDELVSLVKTDKDVRNDFAFAQNTYALTKFAYSENDERVGHRQLQIFKKRYRRNTFFYIFKNSIRYTAVVIMTVLATWVIGDSLKPAKETVVSYEEFFTPPGQRAMIKLHDGTTVWLNAASKLRYPNVFAGDSRQVELDGEAYFDVTRNENVPFIVTTRKLNIEVLGTRFNVFAYSGDEDFNAFLEEGAIRIYNANDKGNALLLEPNESAELKDNRLVKRTVSNKEFLLWKDGIYAFDDIPFAEILKKLELYYDIRIRINNTALAEYKFSGKFRQRDGVVSALRTFQKAYRFTFYKDDELNQITIQ